jgi:hypothetical protein
MIGSSPFLVSWAAVVTTVGAGVSWAAVVTTVGAGVSWAAVVTAAGGGVFWAAVVGEDVIVSLSETVSAAVNTTVVAKATSSSVIILSMRSPRAIEQSPSFLQVK